MVRDSRWAFVNSLLETGRCLGIQKMRRAACSRIAEERAPLENRIPPKEVQPFVGFVLKEQIPLVPRNPRGSGGSGPKHSPGRIEDRITRLRKHEKMVSNLKRCLFSRLDLQARTDVVHISPGKEVDVAIAIVVGGIDIEESLHLGRGRIVTGGDVEFKTRARLPRSLPGVPSMKMRGVGEVRVRLVLAVLNGGFQTVVHMIVPGLASQAVAKGDHRHAKTGSHAVIIAVDEGIHIIRDRVGCLPA